LPAKFSFGEAFLPFDKADRFHPSDVTSDGTGINPDALGQCRLRWIRGLSLYRLTGELQQDVYVNRIQA
jgi:hypothetical protein